MTTIIKTKATRNAPIMDVKIENNNFFLENIKVSYIRIGNQPSISLYNVLKANKGLFCGIQVPQNNWSKVMIALDISEKDLKMILNSEEEKKKQELSRIFNAVNNIQYCPCCGAEMTGKECFNC